MPGCALPLKLSVYCDKGFFKRDYSEIKVFFSKLSWNVFYQACIEKDNMIREDRSSLEAAKDALLMLPITQSAWYRRCGALLRNHNRSSFEHKWRYIKQKEQFFSKGIVTYFSLDHVVTLFSHLRHKAIHVYHLLGVHLLHQRVNGNERSRASDASTK